jgi:molybdate/tungstate transport system substrate-binding protein
MLAEEHYGDPSIFPSIIGESFEPPLEVVRQGEEATITLPELLKPRGQKIAIRDGSIYLLALLDAGGIDYAFEYLSVTEGHGLRWVDLPAEIDLGSAAHADDYARSRVVLGFRRFQSVGNELVGQPIVYAVTIPADAPHPDEARLFVEFVCDSFREQRYGWPKPCHTMPC